MDISYISTEYVLKKTVLRSAVSLIFVYLQINMGLSIYYVIWDRGGGIFPIYYNIT